MKKLFVAVALGLLGYYAYEYWVAKPVPAPVAPPVVTTAVTAKPEPVSFSIKSRVRQLLAEWKRRSGATSAEPGFATIDPAAEIAEIRKALFREGAHSEAEVGRVVSRALRELGVAENEIQEVTRGILGMGTR